ncbi:DNA alkylation repair protein [Falsibacillus pallidus]|uniref:3-methyladenine DNA glycosylase AlkD n=1 Tax=Falsibacillus pallidus TaxID=493781 RepID=A0A370GC49_9BACI|nr:DNA alkylation repair protein [Falsibacillus pallidus]RDI41358.1 3-methyladenine DNA glycosylase AlkD [Falsibacillus pallidus]
MTLQEVMEKLEAMGSEQTKKTFMRHGAAEPLFGVKIGDMKKLVKSVKKDQELVQDLYNTGNSDAMYLAGLSVNPSQLTKEQLQEWVQKAYWHMIAEYTVAGAAAESPFAMELAMEWIDSEEEMIAACGWSTYANYVTITPDDELDFEEIRSLLVRIKNTIHEEKNRARYAMNCFLICVGGSVLPLTEEVIEVARHIGKVNVDVGNTACKVPLAVDYIKKIEQRGKLGAKKKTCIC